MNKISFYEARMRAGLSLRGVVEKSKPFGGVSLSTVHKAELGMRNPRPSVKMILSKVVGYPIEMIDFNK